MVDHRIARGLVSLAIGTLLLAGCTPPPATVAPLADSDWTTIQGEKLTLKDMMGTVGTVFLTLDPECPFCQLYTHTFSDIAAKYAGRGVNVVGLYPGHFMELEEALTFSTDAGFEFPQVMDDQCKLSLALRARVTPECFLTDANGTVVYRGAVDDRAVRQGQKKYEAQEHYLANAIDAFLASGKSQEEVVAVGCIVECEE
ncbi:MAG: redoxin domain-containing protein [Flavobacteriales bacterium]